MKYSDIDNLKKAKDILERVEKRLENCDAMIDDGEYSDVDVGGIPNVADTGYRQSIGHHKDGSGARLDLSGCYVAEDVILATRDILETKREDIRFYIKSFGVEFEDDE